MARRRVDPRRIRSHFAYSVDEAARALQVHKNTVRAWIKNGLPVADDRRPVILSGAAIRAFLTARTDARKRPLSPGQFYCLRCRDRVRPFGDIADLVTDGTDVGTLHALCPGCGSLVYRRVSMRSWRSAVGNLAVTVQSSAASPSLDQSTHPIP